MKKQLVILLGIFLTSSLVQAERVRHLKQKKGNCVIVNRAKCSGQTFIADAEGKEAFERAPLAQADFSDSIFDGQGWASEYFDMRSTDLVGAKFKGATLKYVEGIGIVINKANFDGATLEQVRFETAHGRRSSFKKATLRDVVFNRGDFAGADFSGLKEGSTGLYANSYAIFTGANFSKADLKNSEFIDARMQQANFTGSILDNINFLGAHLDGASFKCATFTGETNFDLATLTRIDLTGADLSGAELSNADLSNLEGHYCGTAVSSSNGTLLYRSAREIPKEKAADYTACKIPDGEPPPKGFCNEKK